MNRAKVIVGISFVVAFAAGAAAGMLAGWPAEQSREKSVLTKELDLTPQQKTQMRKIWSEVTRDSGRQLRKERQALQKERDESVRALLTKEQNAQYEAIMQDYSRKSTELAEGRKKQYREAVESTKKILTESQRGKYEELLKKRGERGRRYHRGNREKRKTEAHDTPQGGE